MVVPIFVHHKAAIHCHSIRLIKIHCRSLIIFENNEIDLDANLTVSFAGHSEMSQRFLKSTRNLQEM